MTITVRCGTLKGVKPGDKIWRVEEDVMEQFIADSQDNSKKNKYIYSFLTSAIVLAANELTR